MIHGLKLTNNTENIANSSRVQNDTEQKSLSQIRAEFAEKIMDQIQGMDFESEEERLAFQSKIEKKIKTGAKLSRKEMAYLRKYNPYMYHQMVRVQQKREALKEQLKHCKSKEEAQQVISAAFSSISEKDPEREAMVAAVSNVSEQFRSSEFYEKLPDTEEDLKKAKELKKPASDPFKQDAEDAGDRSEVYETLSYSFSSSGYQEATTGDFSGGNAFAANA